MLDETHPLLTARKFGPKRVKSQKAIEPSVVRKAAQPLYDLREVLLVEDDAHDAPRAKHLLAESIASEQLKVIGNGEDGLDYLFGTGNYEGRPPGRPQLILLDLDLPHLSATEFLRCVKEEQTTRDIPVILLSPAQSDRGIMPGVRLGAADYLIKPLDRDALIGAAGRLGLRMLASAGLSRVL